MTHLCSFSHTVIPKEGQPYPVAHFHKFLPTQTFKHLCSCRKRLLHAPQLFAPMVASSLLKTGLTVHTQKARSH